MVRRILRAIYQVGVDRWGPPPEIDMDAHHHVALQNARQGMVLLKNDKVLPLAPETRSVAAIGGFGHLGVPTGTGSSAVTPPGGFATVVPIGGPGIMGEWRNLYLLPTSPVTELKRRLPEARIEFDPGINPTEAATLARRCEVAVVFGIRVEGEGFDLPDLTLPWGQDAVIDAVAAANPNTIVVLETGSAVVMPWRNRVKGIVQAWYPGQAGGQAIAELLTGEINPSGRLPITFPSDLAQTPRPELPGLDTPWGTATTIQYHEGAEVGHRWYAKTQAAPLYAFGHGLSYTHFTYTDLEATGGDNPHRNVLRHQYWRSLWRRRTAALSDPCRGRTTDATSRLSKAGTLTRGVTPGDHHRRASPPGPLRRRRSAMAYRTRHVSDRAWPRPRMTLP